MLATLEISKVGLCVAARRLALLSPFLFFALGCSSSSSDRVLRLATTTSTRDSGLLDQLLPEFEAASDCRVDVIAVGTGAALALGRQGDADVLLVHAPEAELKFMDDESGIRRETFMHNHFVILGPPHDPAGVKGSDPVTAMQRMTGGKVTDHGMNPSRSRRLASIIGEVQQF